MSSTSAGTTLASLTADMPDVRRPTHDWGILPIPKRLRYDPEKPFHFGLPLNVFFGICNTLVCANLYYCQPILIQLADYFDVDYDRVSRIPTLVQAGYGIGLLTVSPMGDKLRRRGLILFLISSSMCLTVGLAVTKNLYVFEAISFLIGFTSVSPQIFIPLAADLASPERRASAISVVSSGFLLGILIARVLSGIIANFVSWRYVYWMSTGVQGLVLVGSYLVLPDYPAKDQGLSYRDMFYSMAMFLVREPLVVQILFISIAASACYTNFWVTLTFLLGGPPYNYSTILIGLFGLLGILSVIIVPFMGRVIDKMAPWNVALIATFALICSDAVQVAAGGVNVAAVVISCFGLDCARQTQQIALATLIFGISENARSRLNSLLLLAIFLGQVIGTAGGTEVFVNYGWRANALLAMGWFVWQLGILLLRGPYCPRYRWVGWQSGLWMKNVKVTAVDDVSTAISGCASDPEKADVSEASTSDSTGSLELDKVA